MGKVEPTRTKAAASSERLAFSTALGHAQDARGHATKTQDAVNVARSMVAEADARLKEARLAVGKEKDARAALVADAAASGAALSSPLPLREARTREIEAQDNLEAAQAALGGLEKKLEQAAYAAKKADEQASIAANAVIAAEAPQLLARATATQEELIRLRVALRFIAYELGLDAPDAEPLIQFLKDKELPGNMGAIYHKNWSVHPEVSRWKSAYEKLLTDPEAPLPV